ncbi:hypothetical protein AY606_13075 [Acinetobacter sp. SFB]|nr:hypothetical protein AY606_13075 [Acinetobacter sp. SFB]
MDDFLVNLLLFQSLSPIVCLAIALLNQKKKIDYFFQITESQTHIAKKNPNYNVIYLFRHSSTQRKMIKLWRNVFTAPTFIGTSLLFCFFHKKQRF